MDILVVGAGLAGLTAAVDLHQAGLSVTVVDARDRVGGRLLTIAPDGDDSRGWIDLGATWRWSDQPEIEALASDLGIASFPQHVEGRGLLEESPDEKPVPIEVPPASPVELRFVGGAQQLCERLAARLPTDSLVLGASVTAVTAGENGLTATAVDADTGAEGHAGDATADTLEMRPSFVVVTVPPRLALERITFSPALPDHVVEVMRRTTTWMARAVKCVAIYRAPFWRDAGLSGFALSRCGPLREVHDACTLDGEVAALWGFLAGDDAFSTMGSRARAELALAQLELLFGPAAGDPLHYFERDWSADPNTIDDEWYWVDGEPLEYGHPALAQPMLGGRLVLAGAETVAVGGGHMEGAVRSGHRAAALIKGAAAL